MNVVKLTYEASIRRPIIVILPAVLVLVFLILNSYNPVLPIIMGISMATGAGFFESMVSILQLVLDRQIIAGAVLLAAGAVLLVALASGIIFSGYFPIVSNTLEGRGKTKGEFRAGFKKYFFKLFLISLRASLIAGLIAVVMVVAAVPAIIITRAAFVSKPELMLPAIFVDILTGLVLFFGYMFCKVYLIYWYPAAVKDLKRPFRLAKSLVDRHFFRIISRLVVFDAALAVILLFLFLIPSPILQLILGWILATAFATILIIYIFQSFGEVMVSNGQDDRS